MDNYPLPSFDNVAFSARDVNESQLSDLAQGLLRLEQTARGGEASPDSLKLPSSYPPDTRPAGIVLSQMLTGVSMRVATWGQRLLTAATREFAATGSAPAGDAYFYADE